MSDYDLVAVWEAHLQCDFETKDPDATMKTMAADPWLDRPTRLSQTDGREGQWESRLDQSA